MRIPRSYNPNIMQAAQDTQRGAQAASRSVTTLQSELRDLKARQGGLAPLQRRQNVDRCACDVTSAAAPAPAGQQLTVKFVFSGDPLMAFGGAAMKTLMRAIETAVNQGRFHRPPLGPLGSLLTLTDESWALPVEVWGPLSCSALVS